MGAGGDKCTHIINTVLLQHVSALKGPSSESTSDTGPQQDQQICVPDVKFSLSSSVYYAVQQLHVGVTQCS